MAAASRMVRRTSGARSASRKANSATTGPDRRIRSGASARGSAALADTPPRGPAAARVPGRGARAAGGGTGVLDLGSRRELFVDDHLIERTDRVELRLHAPVPRNVAIAHDVPWEGNTCCYHTVFQDGRLFRMYYRGSHYEAAGGQPNTEVVCYAESPDGVTWHRPELGLVNYQGSTRNNILWDGIGSHNFAPFRDRNPDCRPGEEYKALASHGRGLWAFKSADGVRWSLLRDRPVITEGAFDSQNLAFWDPLRGCYVDFHRHFFRQGGEAVRHIMTCTSRDFRRWTKPVWLDFGDAPLEHLYTNAVTPYYRAPHIYVGFPKRFVPTRSMYSHLHDGVSDAVFMTSRDGVRFRRWGEAFVRPGLQPERWENRNNMTAWGILETANDLPTAPPELSIFTTESYYRGHACRLRRATVRLDGFVSANAPLRGGELVTRVLTFAGTALTLNVATSAAGAVRVEIQGAGGRPLPGYALADCDQIYGDCLDRVASWRGSSDVGPLAGQPVKLRFVLSDADLYSLKFAGP